MNESNAPSSSRPPADCEIQVTPGQVLLHCIVIDGNRSTLWCNVAPARAVPQLLLSESFPGQPPGTHDSAWEEKETEDVGLHVTDAKVTFIARWFSWLVSEKLKSKWCRVREM